MNPLLVKSSCEFEAVDFNIIKTEHFLPALKESIVEANKNLDKIRNEVKPSFQNIIVSLESASDRLDSISMIFDSLYYAQCTDDMAKIAEEFNQILVEFTSSITLDDKIFKQVEHVFKSEKSAHIGEDLVLLEETFSNFTRNGALLDCEKKEILKSIDQKLSGLGIKFSENIRHSINEYVLEVSDVDKLNGLPDSAKEAAREKAKEKKVKSEFAFTLDFPSFYPLLQYCKDEGLRETIWKASSTKAMEGKYSNQENILEILRLRSQRAELLGYKDHASFVLEKRMAKESSTVVKFIDDILEKAMPKAIENFNELKDLKKSLTGSDVFRKSDAAFYTEILKKKQLNFNDEVLRPYFQLEKVVDGVFEVASKMYGLKFIERNDLPRYHEDVNVYEVQDKDKSHLGLFYTDFFPRAEKKPGAWMTTYRGQGLEFDEIKRPLVSIVCNFTKPTNTRPSLLTLDEVLTLYHEFGHGLHGLLGDTKYKSLSGTNVLWDFVELPSQIMENWVLEKECLSLFANHYESGELISDELIEKIRESQTFLEGMATVRQMSFSRLDMDWHLTDINSVNDVLDFEKKSLASTDLFKQDDKVSMSCSFGHIFPGGYSSGYYSYKWAEVLDADAFDLFKEKGIFDTVTAEKFRREVLSKGSTKHPMELYKNFRGAEPSVEPLLRRAGLLS